MKTTKWALAIALGVVALVAAPAYADTITTYTINFTTTSGGPAPASGSFTYDSTNPLFTNFQVNWNGGFFDLTAAANSPFVQTTCTGAAATPAYGFAIMSHTVTGCTPVYSWAGGILAGTTTPSGFVFRNQPPSTAALQDAIRVFLPSASSGITTTGASGGWSITPVPEPASLLLLGTGLVSLLLARRPKLLA